MLGPDLHCVGPRYYGNFRKIFSPNLRKDQINVLPSECRAPGTAPYGKSGPGYCIMFIKMLDEGLTMQVLGQKPLISPRLYK